MVTTEAQRYRMQGRASVDIAAPPAVVWALVGDVRRMGEWSPETRQVDLLDGATEPGVGVRFRGRNRRGVLQRWSTRPVIRVFEPERELAFVLGTKHHD